ncbi:hypothetical protein SAMN02910456_02417 [Ruminococcaceae bacterium YRB3002]|nr:hypothetical protein SAMN02910456_02417 [Ruminococcaceae bacterium YRB3002]
MTTQNPAVTRRKGNILAVAAVIVGIISLILGLVSFWFVFWLAYGRQNHDVIMTSALSLLLVVPILLAITMSIIAKVRGAYTAIMIGGIIPAVLALGPVALNAYILIYYIGLTY